MIFYDSFIMHSLIRSLAFDMSMASKFAGGIAALKGMIVFMTKCGHSIYRPTTTI
jgi:hypothetical protein